MTLPWRSGGSQLCDAATRIELLVSKRRREPAQFLAEGGPGMLARAYADYRDQLEAVRHAIDGELARLENEQAPRAGEARG